MHALTLTKFNTSGFMTDITANGWNTGVYAVCCSASLKNTTMQTKKLKKMNSDSRLKVPLASRLLSVTKRLLLQFTAHERSNRESMPWCQWKLIVFVGVVYSSLQVDYDGVVARDSGGNVHGNHSENRVAAEGERSFHNEKRSARAQRSTHGTNRNSNSSSTPFTVFSTKFTFLQR
jgi:hypothetical protein